MTKLSNIDQTGFITKRLKADNIRRLFNIIHLANTRNKPTIALSLDAEKVFDRLEWPLLKVLNNFRFGASFINWVKTLYHKPQAKIVTNGIMSTPITLQRSSRQGCPLSVRLFVLAIEPLAQAVRQDSDIKGVQVGHLTHKISLFADDIIFFLTDPARSLTRLQPLLNSYSIISHYTVNYEKSEILPLTKADQSDLCQTDSFKWAPKGFTYLGIQVDSNLKNLFKLNYPALIQTIESDLNRWTDLPLTSCIKMNILPRIKYLFQSLPIALPNNIFETS